MNPVIFALDERLGNPGDTLSLAGHLDESGYELGEHEFELPEGIDYDLALTNAGEGILVTGMIRCHVKGACDRCLEDAEFDIAGEVDEYYLFEEPEDPESYEDGFELVSEDRTIDLSDAIADAVVMDTPFVVLCRPDCAGLCPTCGANLNEAPCACEDKQKDDYAASDSNPFAALKNLKFDE